MNTNIERTLHIQRDNDRNHALCGVFSDGSRLLEEESELLTIPSLFRVSSLKIGRANANPGEAVRCETCFNIQAQGLPLPETVSERSARGMRAAMSEWASNDGYDGYVNDLVADHPDELDNEEADLAAQDAAESAFLTTERERPGYNDIEEMGLAHTIANAREEDNIALELRRQRLAY